MCEFEKNKRAIYLTERHFLHRKKFLEEDLQEDVFSIKTPQWILDDPDYGQRRYQRGLSWNQISTAMRYCQLLYSAGLPMPEVVSATHDMLERFHKHFTLIFPKTSCNCGKPIPTPMSSGCWGWPYCPTIKKASAASPAGFRPIWTKTESTSLAGRHWWMHR